MAFAPISIAYRGEGCSRKVGDIRALFLLLFFLHNCLAHALQDKVFGHLCDDVGAIRTYVCPYVAMSAQPVSYLRMLLPGRHESTVN